jgi:hypothetical protein
MKAEVAGVVVVLLVGAAFSAVVARRIWSGKSYISDPAMMVLRKDDPFSFWTSLIIPGGGFAALLTIGGLYGLWRALVSG